MCGDAAEEVGSAAGHFGPSRGSQKRSGEAKIYLVGVGTNPRTRQPALTVCPQAGKPNPSIKAGIAAAAGRDGVPLRPGRGRWNERTYSAAYRTGRERIQLTMKVHAQVLEALPGRYRRRRFSGNCAARYAGWMRWTGRTRWRGVITKL
jgi:hypothetical protein